MKLAHWYHAYVDGDWTEPVLEHVDALLAADFTGPVYLGLVGSRFWRSAAAAAFEPLNVRVAVEADSGFEQVTLAKVREYAQTHDGAVMYAHTKGSADASEFRKQWRRSMTRRVVSEWRANLALLAAGDGSPDQPSEREEPGFVVGLAHKGAPAPSLQEGTVGFVERADHASESTVDAIGCHWLTREGFPGFEQEFPEGIPFFGGNFWIARCDYLRRLPEPSTRSRFDAERWIGLGNPRVVDLNPGWPAANLFA